MVLSITPVADQYISLMNEKDTLSRVAARVWQQLPASELFLTLYEAAGCGLMQRLIGGAPV